MGGVSSEYYKKNYDKTALIIGKVSWPIGVLKLSIEILDNHECIEKGGVLKVLITGECNREYEVSVKKVTK